MIMLHGRHLETITLTSTVNRLLQMNEKQSNSTQKYCNTVIRKFINFNCITGYSIIICQMFLYKQTANIIITQRLLNEISKEGCKTRQKSHQFQTKYFLKIFFFFLFSIIGKNNKYKAFICLS